MRIVVWAAIAVTALFALMNLGVVPDADQDTWTRVAGAVLGIAGLAAAAGFALARSWGRPAVIAVGVVNVVISVVGLATDEQGSVIGIVVGGLGALLGACAVDRTRRGAATA